MKKTKLLVSVLLCAAMLATTACGGSKLPTEPASTPTPVAETKNDPKNEMDLPYHKENSVFQSDPCF